MDPYEIEQTLGPDVWLHDPDLHFLNHGSFGACPRPVLHRQQELRGALERDPVQFMTRTRPQLLDTAREALAEFLGADSADLVFIPNATSAVNAVLHSIRLEPGDEILITNHSYNACSNAVRYVCERAGANSVTAAVPFPISGPQEVIESIMQSVTDRTRLVVLDHITSPTALIFPVRELVEQLKEKGIEVLIDGAHVPGQLPLNLDDLGAAYYTGNCHKWMCSPKGSAFLHVRRDLQENLYPSVISHGLNTRRPDHSAFQDLFDWPGTIDPTAICSIPAAINFLNAFEGGWKALAERNRSLCLAARNDLLEHLQQPLPAPDEMIASMATISLGQDPNDPNMDERTSPSAVQNVQVQLYKKFRIEVPILYWPNHPSRWIRISAQAYNARKDYVYLREALEQLLPT